MGEDLCHKEVDIVQFDKIKLHGISEKKIVIFAKPANYVVRFELQNIFFCETIIGCDFISLLVPFRSCFVVEERRLSKLS